MERGARWVVAFACLGCAQASISSSGSDSAVTFGPGTNQQTATDTTVPIDSESESDPSDPADSSTDPSMSGPDGNCGDGIVDPGEQCDLGPDNAPDGQCTPECTITSCGDGFVEGDLEECDDGDADNTDECLDNCRVASCGDGFVQVGVEGCDDANGDDGDGCRNDCTLSSCGDGMVQAPETCDDMNTDNSDACLDTCASATCGDGFVQTGVEGCDDGENGSDSDACLGGCVAAACGDGVVHVGVEECDDSENGDNGDACVSGCQNAACGDGHVYVGNEECDDGNMGAGDGCDAACLAEAITFMRDFTGGVNASAADCAAWDAFRSSLADDHASVTMSGTNDGVGRTCTGPEAGQICTALRNGSATAVACDGVTWYVDNCGGIELTADNAGCTCQSPGYAVRPCIAHVDWGGVNTPTCAPPSQTITVSCGY